MWTRKELKTKSKIRFKANYWKSVLISLVLLVLLGGGSGVSSFFSEYGNSSDEELTMTVIPETEAEQEFIDDVMMTVFIIVVVAITVFVVCLIVIPLLILVCNPLEVGCRRFFTKNLKEDAQVREICYAFDNGYKNIVKTMFLRNLFTFLWSLLFIIPGIIKSYEYRMIPYILAEHPQMERKEVFALSKKMMHGNKWKSFVLDLSFLGWDILNICTFGILGIFYVGPYEAQTEAALYEAVKKQ